jgi:hypothetical protein
VSNGRRSWLPSQKGTELFPKVTQSPARLVIKGVPPNSPLYHAVANTFAGPLKAFHAKAQQAYALSNNQISKARFNWGPARATYVNLHGQEYIELEVVIGVLEEIEEQLKKPQKDHWDWALIEFAIPNTGTQVVQALVNAVRKAPAPHEDDLKFAGFAYDYGKIGPDDGITYYSDGLDPFVISFAPHADPIVTTVVEAGATQIVSLLVDMRRFPEIPVVIDVYAVLVTNLVEERIYAYRRNPAPDRTMVSDVDVGPVLFPTGWPYTGREHLLEFQNLGFNVDYSDLNAPLTSVIIPGLTLSLPSEVYAPAPRLHEVPNIGGPDYNDSDIYGLGGLLTGVTQYTYFQHIDPSTGLASPDSFVRTEVLEWDLTPLTAAFPVEVTETRLVPVSGLGGFGWPQWSQTKFDGPSFDFYRWEMTSTLPDHIHMGRIGETVFGPAPAGEAFVDSTVFVGTIMIDPVFKSISFVDPN